MNATPRIRSSFWIAAAAGAVAAALLGGWAGHQYAAWKASRTMTAGAAGVSTGETTKLRAGRPLPDIKLIEAGGGVSRLRSMVSGNPALLLVASLDCVPCTEAMHEWLTEESVRGDPKGLDDGPERGRVLIICDDSIEFTEAYMKSHTIPAPLLCDELHVLSQKYGVTVYPTVIGVKSDGVMAFVRPGIGPGFTPEAAWKLIGNGD